MRASTGWTCDYCLKASKARPATYRHVYLTTRSISRSSPLWQDSPKEPEDAAKQEAPSKGQGAMSRRLSGMTEEMMENGGRSARKAMQEAGFSEDLKKELEEKIARTAFRAENQQAISVAETPSYAGAGTRAQAGAEPWTGNETLHDSALRMLDDAHPKLRMPGRGRMPTNVNLKPAPKPKRVSAGERLANARDKTSIYAQQLDGAMSDKERDKLRQELKERFTPGARQAPVTLGGLASLANERIEDAIARGQFKNIERGKGVNIERDYNASSPFLDTTEYFMNKIIQKQEIVPPWIEKQQELIKAAHTFRTRLRAEWRRHAARMIASEGGSLEDQLRRATAYALAEEKMNPAQVKREAMTQIDSQGNLSSVVIEQTPPEIVPSNSPETTSQTESTSTITISEGSASAVSSSEADAVSPSAATAASSSTPETPHSPSSIPSPSPPPITPAPHRFRDPSWESIELSYHTLAIKNLNEITRSYNLMAPKIAQKPYFNLPRELSKCYAECASQLALEIAQRARAPRVKVEVEGHRRGGVMERFSGTEKVRVRDERRERHYGWKEFWRDLWRKDDGGVGV